MQTNDRYPMEYLLHQILPNSAARHGEHEAVRMDGKSLTYSELDRLTNQIARQLHAAGVRRGDRVGIYVNKSIASVISVFGIMKAGAAYVPLDPNAPAKRLTYITRDCNIQVLLTSSSKAPGLEAFVSEGTAVKTVILLDAPAEAAMEPAVAGLQFIPWTQVLSQSVAPPETPEMVDADLAYILYTSGSTGVPKGVMIAHRTILTFVRWGHEEFQMSPKDRVTSHAPLHFDLSTFDLYATIRAGGTIILVAETLSALPVKLADLLQNERVTITYLVPSILSLMANYGKLDGHDLSALRYVLFAGEVFPIKYLRKLMEAVPRAGYYNLYGPTETNVCTFYKVQAGDIAPDRTLPVPIGKACGNMEVFAVDDQGKVITEPGKEGELCARGSCVAQGYWGDREKTARAFVQNPFNSLYPDIIYRTGDIVTLAEDRVNWNYVGRRDHMIKSRGYRVELGEIENVLYRHEQVKEAAVVAIPDELLGSRIRCYVVLADGATATPKDLEAFCVKFLPKYMVPEKIELRDFLPKTSSGKVDRPLLLKQLEAKPAVVAA